MTAPLIGIPGRRKTGADLTAGPDTLRHLEADWYYADYARAVIEAGGMPVHLPLDVDPEQIVDRLDGILLPGGADIGPERYDARPETDEFPPEPIRDDFELALYHAACAAELAVLGICRGLQLINVAEGGSLHQHVPTHSGFDHPPETLLHSVTTEEGSVLRSLYGPATETNSLHHQTVDGLGAELRATAWSGDGTIEGIEHRRRPVIAVQWHPEMLPTRAEDPCFRWLVDLARGASKPSTTSVSGMAIACVYCGGSHDTAREIRQCWQDNEGELAQDSTAAASARATQDWTETSSPRPTHDPTAAASPRPTQDPTAAASPRPTQNSKAAASAQATQDSTAAVRPVARQPGPDALGRHVVIQPGGTPPDAWARAPVVSIDSTTLASPGALLDQFRRAARDRSRLVIEFDERLGFGPERPPRTIHEGEPYTLTPSFDLALDEVHHHLWANSVDYRDPIAPRWSLLDAACELGATPTAEGEVGDVTLADGTPIWLDGGLIGHQPPLDGVAVVGAAWIEHGWLRAAQSADAGEGPAPSSAMTPATAMAPASAMELAPDQLAAVTHTGGAARIIAPAGSGKTRVLTERARHLLTRWNLPASALTLVAFNKRAQEEMVERSRDLPGLQVRTLNSIGLAIINGTPPFAPQPRQRRTLNEPDVRSIIAQLVSFPRRRNSDPVAPWIEALSLIRLGLVPPDEAEAAFDGDVVGLAAAWPGYRGELDARSAVDFDDQIYRAIEVLLTDPDARAAAQRACRVLLVDEFQDLTPAHLLLVRLLAAPGGAVFGVGDDDQTIYGYNGADPAWLIDFDTYFPGAESHPLEVNYRCPPSVVEAADRLLRHNVRRVPKTIRSAPGRDESAASWVARNGSDPVGLTRDAVAAALDNPMGVDHAQHADQVAVLTRVNALLAPVQAALVAAGIPIRGGVGLEFADRTSIRSSLAWLRLATAGDRRSLASEDLREALLRPSRSFHPRVTDWICEQSSVHDLERLAGRLNNEKDSQRLIDFAANISALQALAQQGAPTEQLLRTVHESVGLAGAVSTLDTHRHGMNRAAQGDDLAAIRHLAAQHSDAATFESWLRDALAQPRSPDGVVLATVHRVKGLEWPYVVLHLADADQFPHRLAEDVEEERRLFHVAITRARSHLTIVSGTDPSPFVAELTAEAADSPSVELHSPPAAPPTARPAQSAEAPDLDAGGKRRYEELCALRHELRDGKPAYVVFNNKTAAEIAATDPSDDGALLAIAGIGPAKLERYGPQILALLERLRTS